MGHTTSVLNSGCALHTLQTSDPTARAMVKIAIRMQSLDDDCHSDKSITDTEISFASYSPPSLIADDSGECSLHRNHCSTSKTHHYHPSSSAEHADPFLAHTCGSIFKFSELFMLNSVERDAFLMFVYSGLWTRYLDMNMYEALRKCSQSMTWGAQAPKRPNLSGSALQIYESELATDSIVNMDRSHVEDCFSAKELRSLAVAILSVCYAKYGRDEDAELLSPFSKQSYASGTISGDLCWESLDFVEDDSFFLDPVNVLHVVIRSTSRHEFVELLSDGDWTNLLLPVFDHLDLSLSVCEVVESKHGSSHYSLFYANKSHQRLFNDSTGPVFAGPRQWRSSDSHHLPTAWKSGEASKCCVRRLPETSAVDKSVLACCLPVMSPSMQLQYMVAIHHPITAFARRQGALRMADFVLFTMGTVLSVL